MCSLFNVDITRCVKLVPYISVVSVTVCGDSHSDVLYGYRETWVQ